MNWTAVGALGELLGAVAVVVSLAYLALQVRQNTRSVRGATYDSLVGRFVDLIQPLASDPELARSLERGVEDWEAAAAEDRSRLVYLFFGLFKFWENMFYQARQGTLEPDQWKGWRALMFSYYSRPGVRVWWQTRRAAFSDAFRDYLEKGRIEEVLPSPSQIVGRPENSPAVPDPTPHAGVPSPEKVGDRPGEGAAGEGEG